MSQVQNLPSKDHFEVELEQSKITHELMKQCWGVNFASPVERGLKNRKEFKVLDVACGSSGSWLLQVSKDYPLAKFVGLDISPIFPKDYSQDNLQFIQCDILKGLPFEDNSFDFVHMRSVIMDLPEERWEDNIRELVRVCKQDGWIELLEIDEVKHMTPTLMRIIGALVINLEHKGLSRHSIGITLNEEISEILDEIYEVDAFYGDERVIPIGNWGGDMGRLAFKMQLNTFYMNDVTKWLKVNEEEYERIIKQYQEEIEQYRTCIISRRICAQKSH